MKKKDLDKYLSFHRKKYFIKSFFRKAKRLIADFVPLQEIPGEFLFYRKTVREQEISIVVTPKTFEDASKKNKVKLLPVEVYALKNVIALPDSNTFLSPNLKTAYYEKVEDFSKDYSITYNTENLLFHSEKLAKLNKRPIVKIEKDAFFLNGNFCFNYFHFLIEILSKVEFAEAIPHFDKILVVTHEKVKAINNMETLLRFFIKDHEIQYLSDEYFYKFPKLWHLTYPSVTVPNIAEGEEYLAKFVKFSPKSVAYVRKVCLENFDLAEVKINSVSKVFLARKSGFRKYNETEILEIAQKYGFQAVYLEDLNIHEQIYLMQNADYIIGPSGAAWANVIFCTPQKTKGLLWLGKVWKEFSVFSTLADFSGVDLYHWRSGDEKSKFHEDYLLDTNEFEIQLKKLLS